MLRLYRRRVRRTSLAVIALSNGGADDSQAVARRSVICTGFPAGGCGSASGSRYCCRWSAASLHARPGSVHYAVRRSPGGGRLRGKPVTIRGPDTRPPGMGDDRPAASANSRCGGRLAPRAAVSAVVFLSAVSRFYSRAASGAAMRCRTACQVAARTVVGGLSAEGRFIGHTTQLARQTELRRPLPLRRRVAARLPWRCAVRSGANVSPQRTRKRRIAESGIREIAPGRLQAKPGKKSTLMRDLATPSSASAHRKRRTIARGPEI